jgi:hypothetical protein
MRHDETPKVDETDVHLSSEHFCPPPQPVRRGTTFIHARPEDYVTEEFHTPAFARPTVNRWVKKFLRSEYAITLIHMIGFTLGWLVGQLFW